MKKFTETYKIDNKVSLDEFEEHIQEKLKDIDGHIIDECCGCCGCCCGEPKCSSSCCIEEPTKIPISFYNENDVISALKTDAKVRTLFNIDNQFNCDRFRSTEANNFIKNEPLYFTETMGLVSPQHISGDPRFNQFVKNLAKKHGLECTVVLSECTGQVTVFALKHTGSNGKECSIKNSLMEIYNLLESIDEHEEVVNSSCTDVAIDNLDDVYTFSLAIYIDNVYLAQLQQGYIIK